MRNHGVILIGCQGCGKDTQTDILANQHGFVPIIMSSVLKAVTDENIKHQINLCISRGELVPDKITIAALREHLNQRVAHNANIVFNGVPRQRDQAEMLEQLLIERGMSRQYFLFETLTDEVAIARINDRISKMKAASLTPRGDDLDPQVVLNRLETFRNRFPELERYLRVFARASIREVPAKLKIQEAAEFIWQAIQPSGQVVRV